MQPGGRDVCVAAVTLAGIAHRTPVLHSRMLDAACGAEVLVKCENFQRTGSFKFRGAYNVLASLTSAQRKRGVVAYSSGNHAQGVALAAKLLGTPATIVMPHDAPVSKLAATRHYGAQVVSYDRTTQSREQIASDIAAREGAVLVAPFDDARIVAGAGTAAAELLERSGRLDAVVVPLGGGGLMAGTALACQAVDPAMRVYGVEPRQGDDFARSLQSGMRVTIDVPNTIADGLQTTTPGELTFRIARELRASALTVSDRELVEAMHFAFAYMKLVIEPSGAAAIAALLQRRVPDIAGKRVGAIVSGGNVDASRYADLMGRL